MYFNWLLQKVTIKFQQQVKFHLHLLKLTQMRNNFTQTIIGHKQNRTIINKTKLRY